MKEQDSDGLILVVDDNPINTNQIRDMLSISSYQSITAESASEGLEIVKTIKPDLILLDIVMPEVNGFSFCETLKSSQAYSHIPIIFITAQPKVEYIDRAYKSGANDFLTKPFPPLELAARIKIQLNNSQEEKLRKKEVEELRAEMITLREELHKVKSEKKNTNGTTVDDSKS